MTKLTKVLDDWANDLAKKAQKATTLQESTDAFKAVSAYHAAVQKNAKKHPTDEDDEGGFSFASSEVVNGGQRAKVRTSRAS